MKIICLHKRDAFYLIHDEVSIHVSDLVACVLPPSPIYKWNKSTSLPERLCQTVNIIVIVLMLVFYNYDFTKELQSFTVAHHLKKVASGKSIVLVPLILFTDDTSGNKSKQWNKFDSWCLKIAGLPSKENSKLHNIHLICCSKCNVAVSAMCLTCPSL